MAGELQFGDSIIEALGHNPTLRVGSSKGIRMKLQPFVSLPSNAVLCLSPCRRVESGSGFANQGGPIMKAR